MNIDSGALAIVFGVLWAVCEGLAQIPAIKANSVFQLISGLLAKIGQPKLPQAGISNGPTLVK